MESTPVAVAVSRDDLFNYGASLYIHGNKNAIDVQNALVERGADVQDAAAIVEGIEQLVTDARKKKAQKDMLYGGLWCVGGTILTMMDIGFIFWGAIIFGAVQFFRGVSNLNGR